MVAESIESADNVEVNVGEWHHGWKIVVAAAMGTAGMALNIGALGTFVVPLSNNLGWTRGQITGALVLMGINQIFLNPLVGRWIDRIGSRKVAMIGSVPYGLAIAALGMVGGSLVSWYTAWFFIALFYPAVGHLVWSAAIIRNFERYRGRALGLVMCGNGLAIAFAPLLAAALIQFMGWRAAYFAVGFISCGLMMPMFLLFPRRYIQAIRPSGDRPGMSLMPSVLAVLHQWRFWKICAPLTIGGGAIAVLTIHMQAMFIDTGVSPHRAAMMMAVMGPTMIVGRLLIGMLLDLVPGHRVATVALSLLVLPLLLMFHYDGSEARGMLAVGILGISYGAELDLLPYLTSRYFGLKQYAAIYGVMLSVFSMAYTGSPMLAGLAYDSAKNYDAIIIVLIVMLLLGTALISSLGRYPQDELAWRE